MAKQQYVYRCDSCRAQSRPVSRKESTAVRDAHRLDFHGDLIPDDRLTTHELPLLTRLSMMIAGLLRWAVETMRQRKQSGDNSFDFSAVGRRATASGGEGAYLRQAVALLVTGIIIVVLLAQI